MMYGVMWIILDRMSYLPALATAGGNDYADRLLSMWKD